MRLRKIFHFCIFFVPFLRLKEKKIMEVISTDISIDAHASKKPCSNEYDSFLLEKVSMIVETLSLGKTFCTRNYLAYAATCCRCLAV